MRAILTYHSIDDSGSVISVSPSQFAEHVRWLASGAVSVKSVDALLDARTDEPAVAITFDDAFANFATHAWPMLRDAGLTATLFVPTAFVGKTNAWDTMPGGDMPALPLLDWPALGRLANEGVSLGAHTRTHADLRALDATAMTDEIAGSIADIARETGVNAGGLAYPYGYHDDRVVAATRSACSWACTTVLQPLSARNDTMRLPRLDSYFLHGPARLSAFGSPLFRGYISARRTVRRLRGR
ncbi:MAG TPA: polysaccharide deacetylase family protein [Gemmatimonadaceae bacterium]|nr:polysaccharide deacetylase family protein [Gemmatimonadaceae bacterium]